jgi:hypothetical protein
MEKKMMAKKEPEAHEEHAAHGPMHHKKMMAHHMNEAKKHAHHMAKAMKMHHAKKAHARGK